MQRLKKYFSLGLIVILLIAGWAIYEYFISDEKLTQPLKDYTKRPKLLTFGLYVTPDSANNPIHPPERFSGYHTALDIEVFEEELQNEVEVFAVCSGRVIFSGSANGYGGVMVQSCRINNQKVTVLYGHLDPAALEKKIGDKVSKGEKIAVLGDARSEETGDTRKHLHLGIHKGTDLELAGYVQTRRELTEYIDPQPLLEI